MYQRVGKSAYKADLDNTIAMATHLDNPENKFRSVHVAGTNGKGSTSHMIASVLQHAGYKVGLYTSPHLKDFRERVRINGQMIPEEEVIDFVSNNRDFFEERQLSFFEMTVGLAFQYFAKEKVDIAIIEVGLGGRLDSTNIITPEVSVITNIGFDHMEFLGDTLEKIAAEKAGIIKEGIPVVIGEKQKETMPVFQGIADDRNAPMFAAEDAMGESFATDLLGSYQLKNLRTAVKTIEVLGSLGWEVAPDAIENGLKSVAETTGLMGRWQVLSETPRTICDTAHNREGLEIVMKQLEEQSYQSLHIVLGVVSDKDLDSILPLFPKDAVYYFCKPNVPRGLEAKKLADSARSFGLVGKEYDSVNAAFKVARESAGEGDMIFIGGSTFTVAEVV